MLTCIIVDDENKARMLLRNMLPTTGVAIEILAECNSLAEGIKAIRTHKPNIVFLDIEMPMQSGIEILNYFGEEEVTFDIVFTTGFSEYALQAFKLSATDYLLKPINPLELKATVERIVSKKERDALASYKALYQNLSISKDAEDKCLTVFLNNATRFVKLRDIIMLHADGAYTAIHTQVGEKLVASRNLKYFEERLEPYVQFMRCQKSFIINVNKVIEFSKSEGEIVLENSLTAQISADKHDLFLEKMKAC
jgi:two-component system, LytTR family, response regulator